MKKLLFMILTLSMLTSCENETNYEQINNLTQSKIDQIYLTKVKNEQRKIFSMLNKNEKLLFWEQDLNKKIKSLSLDEKQSKLLNKIKKKLNADIFDIDSPKNAYFTTIEVPKILTELNLVFSKEEIGNLFYDVASARLMYQDEKKDCDCNRNSTSSCVWLRPDTCESNENTCKETTSGCGFFWAYSCNGVCKPI